MNLPPRAEVPRDVEIDPTRDDLLLLARFRQLALFIAVVGLVGSVVGIGFALGTGPLRFWFAPGGLILAAVVAAGAARTSKATDIRPAARVVAAAVLAVGGLLSFTILPEFPASTTVTLIVGVAFAVAFLPARESRQWVLAAAVAAVLYSVGRELGSGDDVAPGLRLGRVVAGALSGELILAILWLATLSRSDLLARLRRREQAIAESPVGIVILDASRPGRPIVLVNPAFTRITGYEPAESLGRGLEMLAGAESEPELLAAIDRSLGEGRPVEVTIRHYRRDGTPFVDRLALAPIRGQATAETGFVGIIDDVTDAVATEQQLRKAGRMDAVGLLAAGLAHDLNNVMMAIGMGAEQARADLAVEGPLADDAKRELERSLGVIAAAADRAREMTASLLAIGRRQELSPRPLDLNDIVRLAEPVLRRLVTPGQTLTIDLAPGLPSIIADPVRLEQVVLNLVANAHDAIALDGPVQIETAVEIAADASSPGPWRSDPAIGQVVRLSVSDDGRGMAADIVEHIFEPFFTTKDSGTGLGLASVYGIVAQSGGHIACDTVEGAGTTFHVRLPVRRQP